VVLAEDDRDLRTLLAATLRHDGFEVLEAADSAELRRVIRDEVLTNKDGHGVDLVISDLLMPGGNGLGALAALRRRDWSTPILLITGCDDNETRAEAQRLGASAVLAKPFDLDDFRTAVLNYSQPAAA
jgi:DNA-binding response OmpR family regulator